jgi:hypothetical protein
MTEVAALEGYAGLMSEAAQTSTAAAAKLHEYVNGDALTDVATESGPLSSLAKQARLFEQALPDAVAILSAQQSSGTVYSTLLEGRTATALHQHFWVSPAGSGLTRVGLFQKTSDTTQVLVFTWATGNEVDSLVQPTTSTSAEVEHLALTDPEGGQVGRLTSERLETLPFRIESGGPTVIGDGEGGALLYGDDEQIHLGGLEMRPASMPGIFVTDAECGVHQDLTGLGAEDDSTLSPFANGLLFAPVLATGPLRDATLYVDGLLPDRSLVEQAVFSLSSSSGPACASGRSLSFNAERFGSAAVLSLRDRAQPSDHRFMKLTLKAVPVQNPVKPVNILFIGDSIGNRQGGVLLRQYLAELGIAPTFLGTLPGSASATDANDATGELGECREGWETGDFTYAITDRVGKVLPGEEAAYMDLSKTERWPINPFLRVATEADSVDIVRNGYVFDPAFYQQRFGLATPDVVIINLGTNDVRDRTAATIYDHVLANDTLMIQQIKAAWPNAKIIRSVPNTALNVTRGGLWLTHYTPLIRAMRQAASNLAYSKLTIAPLWAMTDPESGYAVPSTAVDGDGFIRGDWADANHPVGASRHGLYAALAPFVAAAAINLI